jgi:hypothetical protein
MLDMFVSRIIELTGCKVFLMLLHERIQLAIKAAKDKGHTIVHIANACGITRQAVYQWRDGTTTSIDGANLVVLAELSGYNAKWIATGQGDARPLSFDESTLSVIKAWKLMLPEDQFEVMTTMLRKIADTQQKEIEPHVKKNR